MTLSELGLTAQPFKLLVFLCLAFGLILAVIIIALFVLKAVGLMTMAEKVGIKNKWFGFVPFLDTLLIGKTAAVYRGKSGRRFKAAPAMLFIIYLLAAVILLAGIITALSGAVDLFFEADEAMAAELELASSAFDGVMRGLSLISAASAVFLVYRVAELFCLYRIFAIFDYKSAVAYTVLSAILGFLVPFFISADSKKEPTVSYADRQSQDFSQFTI